MSDPKETNPKPNRRTYLIAAIVCAVAVLAVSRYVDVEWVLVGGLVGLVIGGVLVWKRNR